MKCIKLGKSDVLVSEIIVGCWVMGGDYWGGAKDDESISAIRQSLDLGINTFDTAEVYGNGRSEEVVGRALEGRRHEAVISTKVWTSHMRKNDLKKACDDSLKRLKTDYIDIYFLHYPTKKIPVEETMEAMLALKKEGKIRSIGISNFNLEEMKKAVSIGQVDVIQPCYSMLWRFIDRDIIPYCIENEIGIIPYSPLAQGILTGKFSLNTQFKEDDGRARAPLFQPEYFPKALEVVDQMKPYAEKYNKTLAQVAINWINHKKGITAAIVGARNAAQAKENFGATGWKMSDEDWAELDEISKNFTDDLPKFKSFFINKIEK